MLALLSWRRFVVSFVRSWVSWMVLSSLSMVSVWILSLRLCSVR